nr:ASN_HP1_G0015830.mRNA.1.CDS.1 [Saccharomyces cerevisiae]
MSIPHSVFSAVLVFVALATTTLASTEACLPTNKREDGMNINFYEYTIGDKTTYLEPEYMGYKYSDTKKLGSVSGQTDLSIYYSPPCESTPTCVTYAVLKRDEDGYDPCGPLYETKKRDTEYCDPNTAYWSSDLFGFYTTPTNVTLEMTGYFLPPQTGSYTFRFATVDDSAILSVGDNVAFECCAQEQPPITSTDFTINGIKPWQGSLPDNIGGTVYMYAGYYYPLKVVYSNAVSWGTLPISVELPDGTIVSDDFEGYVYSFDDDLSQSNCTIPDPSKHTTSIVTTTTELWTGTFTSTSTEMTTVTGTNGQPTDETVIVAKAPTTATSSSFNGTSVVSSSVMSSSVISSSATTSTSTFSESSKSSVIQTSSSTSGSSESKTSSASSSSSSSSISSESPKSPTYSSSSLPPVTSATTSQETASSLPPVTSATTGQETASSLPPATTTKTSEQTTLVTVTSCESHVCTESISSAIVSTATVIVSGVTTEYTTWCPISTTEITKQTTETTKQTKGTTEQTTETTKQTTVVTISSCESDICSKTASPAIVSTSTATINDVTTEYTTWLSISTTESKQQTTLAVTVTSCESGVFRKLLHLPLFRRPRLL